MNLAPPSQIDPGEQRKMLDQINMWKQESHGKSSR
jgi:hypothetical protein